MRILRLDLLAFGHFTNVELDLSGGPGTVHLVYGTNEAGKSTSLRALHALLYGIDARSPDNFLHDHNQLRLGAVVQRADGTTIDFIRRKGNKNTFLDRAGNPVDDAPLRRALNSVDDDLFTSLFGIDHARLVAGGQGMLRAGGDVGESLFSAGFGGVSLHDVLKQLDAEAAALFKSQGQNQPINQACRQYKEARDKVAASSLLSRDYEDRATALETLNRERDEVVARLKTLRRETNRLERIARAVPKLPERRGFLEELAAIGEVPALPEGFSEQRAAACAALESGRLQWKTSEDQLAELDARAATLSVPETLFARAEIITDLYQRLDGHRKAVRELPLVEAERHILRREAARMLEDLDLHDPEMSRLSRGIQRKIRALASQHQVLNEKAATTSRSVTDLHQELEDRREEWRQLPDVTALREAVGEIQRRGDVEDDLTVRRAALGAAETTAAEGLKRLALWSGTLAGLAAFTPPSVETIDRFEKRWLAAENEVSQSAERDSELKSKAARCEREIEEMLYAGSVPSEAELAAARVRRETDWRAIRRAWLEAPGEAGDPEALAASYEALVQHADKLADRLRWEAASVAKHARLAAERDDLARKRDALREETAAHATAWQQLREEWRASWPPFEPLPPREMRTWVQKQERLVEQADGLRIEHEAVDAAQERLVQYRAMLIAHLPGVDGRTLRALLIQAFQLVERADRIARDIERLRREAKTAEAAKADAETALAAWKEDWRETMRELGRPETAKPSEVCEFVSDCGELQEKITEVERSQASIETIRSEADAFESEAAVVIAEFSADLPPLGAEKAILSLYARFNQAKEDAATLAVLKKQRAEAAASLQAAQRTVAAAESTLAAMCRQAGCAEASQLEAIERKSREAGSRRTDLQHSNEWLAAESAGAALEEFIAEIEALDADQLPFEIEENQRVIREHETQNTRLSTEIGGLERDLKTMDGNARAGEAAEEAQSILAQLEKQTERFIRVKLAAAILRREIDDYRARNQSPLLALAGEFFRRLTLGSFTSIAAGFDEDDSQVLEGVRAAGQHVKVGGMSDGTRDQLFLALKLATVERYIAQSEPMPFIVDDVLIGFDHEREAAVLEALGELARKTQVIVFTHHRHLVELAGQVLPGTVRVQNLGARKASVDAGRFSVD